MNHGPIPEVSELAMLRGQIEGSDQDGLNRVLARHRDRLRRMVALRLDPQLQGRLDASDIIQETFVEAHRALANYVRDPVLPVHVWLRRLAGQKLIQAHRTHRRARKRTVAREQRMIAAVPAASSESLAMELVGNHTSPSRAAANHETHDRLMAALEQMDAVDREVLTLRHFEQLTSQETAEALGMNHEAVKKRYIRALEKLQRVLQPGGSVGT